MLEIASTASVCDGRQRLSGEEVDEGVRRVASSLRSKGLRPGSRVLVLGLKSVEHSIALLAVPAAGGVAIAPHHGLSAHQLRHIYADAEPSLTILLESAPASAVAAIPDDAATSSFGDLATEGSAAPYSVPTPGQPVMVIYTSGSTGEPKGVILTYENLMLGAESVACFYGLTSSDRLLCLLPFSFDAGFNQLLSGLVAGCEIHLRDFLLPRHTVEVCADYEISVLTGVPALWRRLIEAEWPSTARASMRLWASTGGHMAPVLSSRIDDLFPAARPILMYGFTEAFRASYLPIEEFRHKPASVGIPIPHAAFAVVGPGGRLCNVGEVGEIIQLGPLVAAGYWNRAAETQSKFAPLPARTRRELESPASQFQVPTCYLDRVAWSGDNGSVDGDGCLYFDSRRTELIKSKGFRVSPTEIESACLATGLVDEVVAFGVEIDDEEAITVVARRASEGVAERDLLEALTQIVPSYQVPSRVVFRDQLPIGAHGKLDRVRLREELSDGVTTR